MSRPLSSPGQSPAILRPSSCTFAAGIVTAVGTFGDDVPGADARRGDVVELYAYAPVANPQFQVVDLSREHRYPLTGSGRGTASWRVSGPVDGQLPPPAHCVVALQSTFALQEPGNDYDSATPAASGSAPATRLSIALSIALTSAAVSVPSRVVATSCVLHDNMVTASGRVTGSAEAIDGRVGAVIELYVYQADRSGAQVADLAVERPVAVAPGPWTVVVPVDARFGRPGRCAVALQSTHAFMGATNAF